MSSKPARAIILAFAILLTSASGEQSTASGTDPSGMNENPIRLDVYGRRGLVFFDHKTHESKISPDPNYPYKVKNSAACAGCHHTANVQGVIQLIKCAACHLPAGNPKNPLDREQIELSSDEAFHKNCLGCHRASRQGPRLCGGCHKMTMQ